MPSRAFTARDPQLDNPDPIEFTLLGSGFRCVPMPPPGAFGVLNNIPTLTDDEDDPSYLADRLIWIDRINTFIRVSITPDDRDKWDRLHLENLVAPEDLVEIQMWLVGLYSERLKVAVDNHTTAPMAAGMDGLISVDDLDPNVVALLDLGGGIAGA